MASTGYVTSITDQTRVVTGLIKTKLLVADLRDLLRQEGLTISGVKSELQYRVVAHVDRLANTGAFEQLVRIRDFVYKRANVSNPYSPALTYATSPSSSSSPQYPYPIPRVQQAFPTNPYAMTSPPTYSNRVTFKNSPFYTILSPLTTVIECRARESTRDTARVNIILRQDVADQLVNDPNIRVMVFCAAESLMPLSMPSEVSFPHQVELKCNTDEVKANLRGLKNKPGSTRPADITNLIRKKANYQNNVEMIYALTSKKFYLVVNLVQKKSIEELVKDLEHGKSISKERVIREMTTKNQDSDVVATSTVLSLKCPLSAMRITVPCRASSCIHNRCFDAASYLQLQEQAPTWTCPICNKHARWEDLMIDYYVLDILQNTSSDTDQVTIEPDGYWHKQNSDSLSRNSNPTPDDDEDDDYDVVEIPDARVSSLRYEQTPQATVATPPLSSRAESLTSSAPKSNKRPAKDVIDLTLSDDDEEPAPKVKRPSMSTHDVLQARPTVSFPFHSPRPSPNFVRPFYDPTLS